MNMKNKIMFLFFVAVCGIEELSAARFTIENYTGKDIAVEVLFDKTWGQRVEKLPLPTDRRIRLIREYMAYFKAELGGIMVMNFYKDFLLK